MPLLSPSVAPNPLLLLADLFDSSESGWPRDPVGFVTDRLGEHLWSKQREIIESVRDHRRTAVASCHGAGKSFLASRTVAWWLEAWPAGEAFAVTTADNFAQVRVVLWRYIGQLHRKANLRGRVNQTEWFIGDELVAIGRKAADDNPTAFQGIHARRVLVVIDEACGVPRELWTAANSLASNEDSRILAIGNPDDPGAYFASVCGPDSGWNVLHVSAFDTPSFTGEAVPEAMHHGMIGPTYVEETRKDCGEASAPYQSKVLGRFPTESEDGVVRISAARKCQHTEPVEYEDDQLLPVELGVDVAAGGDQSAIALRCGVRAAIIYSQRQPDTTVFLDEVVTAINRTGATTVKVDRSGMGITFTDRLVQLGDEGKHAAKVIGVMVGDTSTRPDRFPKLRDQLWWEVGRQLCEDEAWDLTDIGEPVIAQLTAPKYAPDASGRIKVEPKAETKKRLGRSPDEADALLLAFYSPYVRRGAKMKFYPRTGRGWGT